MLERKYRDASFISRCYEFTIQFAEVNDLSLAKKRG